ncbi:MAG: nicotinate phosphoribosyltransferase, partial [Candidatus Eiseniibacteriota bacterium]
MTDPPRRSGALFTDLYELTMLQAYDDRGMDGIATFELMFRELPAHRSYLVTCGVETVLEFLESLAFDDAAIDFLARQGSFRDQFLDRLRGFRFTGDVWAMPEGTIAFPPAPLLQVVAPIGEAQVVETFALMQMHFQTGVASKASRIASAAQGRTVVDFGSRRAQGGALEVARAAYIGGLDGTSNLEAGRRYGIPVFGTMAHSYVEAVGDELEAFRSFATLYPGTTLLVDTYDTRRGIDTVIRLARGDAGRAPGAAGGPRPHREPLAVGGIRLDSGDLGVLAVEARQALDAAGLEEIQIFASGSLDEWRIASLLGAGVPIDGFGVGTRLAVVADAPAGDAVYK